VRVAVVDIGSNSTRLLIADADADTGAVTELIRRSCVTRLGEGLEASGSLSDKAIARVMRTLADYRRAIDERDCERNLAVLTAAVREASNGDAFAGRVGSDLGLDAHVLSGEQEAQLTFLGAMAEQPVEDERTASPTVVIDIGGGSTEFIVGRSRRAGFHTSLPVGVVRMSERHIRADPPTRDELIELAGDARAAFGTGLPPGELLAVKRAIAVAGTATSAAAIEQELDPYDPARVHGYVLSLIALERMLDRVAAMDEAKRRALTGLDPDRAPTIIAGLVILREALCAFELDQVTVSEHDILFGGALRLIGCG
jgi:exopolyphosphatase / guanosine-5'-triphosphate,3'-diphosphate pyrophosphatase